MTNIGFSSGVSGKTCGSRRGRADGELKKKRSRWDASRPLSFRKTGRLRRIVEDRGAGGEGGADGDDPLIGAAAEAEP